MRCIQYERIVLLDSDMMVLRNIDDLFEKPPWSAVVATKCVVPEYVKFNSGLLVLKPDLYDYERLIDSIVPAVKRRADLGRLAGDQDVFQEACSDWEEHEELALPETYNAVWFCVEALCKCYNVKTSDIKVAHFTGSVKPFHRSKWENSRLLLSYLRHLQFWRYGVYRRYLGLCR